MQAFVGAVPASLQRTSLNAGTEVFPISQRAHTRNISSSTSLHATTTKPITKPAPTPPSLALTSQVTVVWLRDDLRLHDNPALRAAVSVKSLVAPLVVLPSKPSAFLLSAISDLRESLRARGGELYVRPERDSVARTVVNFCMESGAKGICFHRAVSKVDRRVEDLVVQGVQELGVEIQSFWTNCLITPMELPFNVKDMPDDCDAFAARVRNLPVRKAERTPESIPSVAGLAPGVLPQTSEKGGERIGLQRVKEYVRGALVTNGKGGIDTRFARLGPFLMLGCLSPRLVWEEVEKGVGENCVRRYCAEFELQLRDFFRLMTLKRGVHPV